MNPTLTPPKLKVMVLAGGPDAEREVSLISGQQVAKALEERGHDVRLRDILPTDTAALDEFQQWRGDVVFLAMHGSWGEGGALQKLLEDRRLPYFGCDSKAGALCMDKAATKEVLIRHGLPTPPHQVVHRGETLAMPAPVVIKPLCEGSSIGVSICKDEAKAQRVLGEMLAKYDRVLVEKFIRGMEMTCGVIGGPRGDEPLPPVQIVPATEFYDYEAKYLRDDTKYIFDIDLPQAALDRVKALALQAHAACGCRHLSRVDFMVEPDGTPWILEINTIPGFTTHSLVPKSAAHAGIAWLDLCERLARLALPVG